MIFQQDKGGLRQPVPGVQVVVGGQLGFDVGLAGDGRMSYPDVPIWEKYTLTIEEAAKYFRIGEKKLRKLAEENPDANWLIMNGNRTHKQRVSFGGTGSIRPMLTARA